MLCSTSPLASLNIGVGLQAVGNDERLTVAAADTKRLFDMFVLAHFSTPVVARPRFDLKFS